MVSTSCQRKKPKVEAQLHVIRKNLDASDEEIAAAIRDYCLSQVDIWREIPFWAWHADGRNGNYYHSEVWTGFRVIEIRHIPFSQCSVHLDLESGELLVTHSSGLQLRDGEQSEILAFFALKRYLDNIDAPVLLARIRREAHMPIPAESAVAYPNEFVFEVFKLEWFGPVPSRPFVRRFAAAS